MPIEIKELVIRAVAVETPADDAPRSGPALADADREALIAECVREVLRILRRAEER